MSRTCQSIHQLFATCKRFGFPFEVAQIPPNGIYVLYQSGERAHGTDRIVRVGTHTGDSQLRSRLRQHFITENKDRSIFRKNIGRAFLNRDQDPFLEQWNWDLTPRKAKERLGPLLDRERQQAIEIQVTEYLQSHFSFVVFEVADKEDRLRLESRLISTVSWCDECRPSEDWLGLHSPKGRIRESGLWLVNELYKDPLSETELAEIEKLVRRTSSI